MAADSDAYAIQTHLGTIEAWRIAPAVVLKWCNSSDPEGAVDRNKKFDSWNKNNAALAEQVEQRFEAFVHLVPLPSSEGNAVKIARARITIGISRLSFLGKNKEETVVYCRTYADENFPLWNQQRVAKVKASLTTLDVWDSQRNANKP